MRVSKLLLADFPRRVLAKTMLTLNTAMCANILIARDSV